MYDLSAFGFLQHRAGSTIRKRGVIVGFCIQPRGSCAYLDGAGLPWAKGNAFREILLQLRGVSRCDAHQRRHNRGRPDPGLGIDSGTWTWTSTSSSSRCVVVMQNGWLEPMEPRTENVCMDMHTGKGEGERGRGKGRGFLTRSSCG